MSHNLPTPAQYRPQSGSVQQSGSQSHVGNYMNAGRISAARLQQTPSQRQPLATVGNSSLNRSGVSGYGMSAGMKVGRQQGRFLESFNNQRTPSTVSHYFQLALRHPRALLTPRIMVKTVVEAEPSTLHTLSDSLRRYTTMVVLITNQYLHSIFLLLCAECSRSTYHNNNRKGAEATILMLLFQT